MTERLFPSVPVYRASRFLVGASALVGRLRPRGGSSWLMSRWQLSCRQKNLLDLAKLRIYRCGNQDREPASARPRTPARTPITQAFHKRIGARRSRPRTNAISPTNRRREVCFSSRPIASLSRSTTLADGQPLGTERLRPRQQEPSDCQNGRSLPPEIPCVGL